MQIRSLGRDGPPVPAIGYGCAALSSAYGKADEAEALRTLAHVIDRQPALLDTSDAYGNGHNERLVGRAMTGRRDEVFLCTKFGNRRGPNGERLGADGRPEFVIASCDASLERLGVETIDLYYQHRVDPKVPIEETMGAVKRLVEAGKVRHAGLCEAGPETLRRAHATHPIAALQSEYSLWTRDQEAEILPACRALGIAFVAYAPLGRGFLTATIRSPEDLEAGERRHQHPRFFPENIERNVPLLASLESVAAEIGASPAKVALAWLLTRGDDVVPIPASRRAARVDENRAACDLVLEAEHLARLDAAFPAGVAAGLRYPEKQLRNMGL